MTQVSEVGLVGVVTFELAVDLAHQECFGVYCGWYSLVVIRELILVFEGLSNLVQDGSDLLLGLPIAELVLAVVH